MARPHLSEFAPLLRRYVELLKSEFGDDLVSVCLFGSVARGDFRPESDIDVLLVVRGLPVDVGQRIERASRVRRRLRETQEYRALRSRNLPRLVSEVIFTPEEVRRHPPVLLDVVVDGVILYDRGGFLKEELRRLRERLSELGARRVRGRRGWYWVLKPGAKFGEAIEV